MDRFHAGLYHDSRGGIPCEHDGIWRKSQGFVVSQPLCALPYAAFFLYQRFLCLQLPYTVVSAGIGPVVVEEVPYTGHSHGRILCPLHHHAPPWQLGQGRFIAPARYQGWILVHHCPPADVRHLLSFRVRRAFLCAPSGASASAVASHYPAVALRPVRICYMVHALMVSLPEAGLAAMVQFQSDHHLQPFLPCRQYRTPVLGPFPASFRCPVVRAAHHHRSSCRTL